MRFRSFPHDFLCALARCQALSSRRGGLAMPTYRAYLIDENDRVATYRPIEAATDT